MRVGCSHVAAKMQQRARERVALRALLVATALAMASEGAAEAGPGQLADGARWHPRDAAEGPEIEALLASHSALHRATVAHAMHRKREQALSEGRPIDLPVIPKSPPVCSAPVPCLTPQPCP
jgi:hypothetical protein